MLLSYATYRFLLRLNILIAHHETPSPRSSFPCCHRADERIDLWTPSYLLDHITNTADDYKAFSLFTDIEFTPTSNTTWTATKSLVTGGNLFFTTAAGYEPMALTFSKGADLAFNINTATELCFDTLSTLTFSDIVRKESTSSSGYR